MTGGGLTAAGVDGGAATGVTATGDPEAGTAVACASTIGASADHDAGSTVCDSLFAATASRDLGLRFRVFLAPAAAATGVVATAFGLAPTSVGAPTDPPAGIGAWRDGLAADGVGGLAGWLATLGGRVGGMARAWVRTSAGESRKFGAATCAPKITWRMCALRASRIRRSSLSGRVGPVVRHASRSQAGAAFARCSIPRKST